MHSELTYRGRPITQEQYLELKRVKRLIRKGVYPRRVFARTDRNRLERAGEKTKPNWLLSAWLNRKDGQINIKHSNRLTWRMEDTIFKLLGI